MLKKTIKYTDFDGTEREEEHYFNLTRSEIDEMQLSENGGLDKLIKKMLSDQDVPSILRTFLIIVEKSYGIKSADGKHFRKSKEIWDDFKSTLAYDALYVELTSNQKAMEDFINNVIPKVEKTETK